MPNGTKNLRPDGYVAVKVDNSGTWRNEHSLVMEAQIGRRLGAKEIVHHIDGNRANNRPENLFLCRDRKHHNEVHRSQDKAMRALLADGQVVFEGGRYEAVLRGR